MRHATRFFCLLLLPCVLCNPDFLVVIASQAAPAEVHLSGHLKRRLVEQGLPEQAVLEQHEMPDSGGFWTYKPLFHHLATEVGTAFDWLVLLRPDSRATAQGLNDVLGAHPPGVPAYFATGITDSEWSIRHHFQVKPYPYPLMDTDMALSRALFAAVAEQVAADPGPAGFHIDPEWELAVYLHDTHNVTLTPLPAGLWAAGAPAPAARAPWALSLDEVVVAVKTVEHFHKDRVPVVKATWAGDVRRLHFYSNAPDEAIPTIWEGVPNAARGHCGKLRAILRDLSDRYLAPGGAAQYFVVVDDDTLLSVPRLLRALAAFDPAQPVFAGERYGYGLQAGRPRAGYNYMTGGSGMILSAEALRRVAACGHCRCADDAPDDMFLGMWMKALGVPALRVPGMHQAAPKDYHEAILTGTRHVSFHSCRGELGCDARAVYARYLKDEDGPDRDEL